MKPTGFANSSIILKRRKDGSFSFEPKASYNFGDLFEWFIAQVLRKEFFSPSAWGVKIKDTLSGGDYDVLSIVEGHLLYIEAKSSPPKHIEEKEIASFLDRIEDLRPHFSIFIEDTTLRMTDKIIVLFKHELLRRYTSLREDCLPIKRLERELFLIGDAIYVINSHPDLINNLAFTISHFLLNQGFSLSYLGSLR